MKLSNFKFKLPAEQVALYPHIEEHTLKSGVTFKLKRPDQCRLMVLHKKSQTIEMYRTDADGNQLKDADGNPEYLRFVDIVNYFDEGDTFIFNDTKVFPARLYGTKEKTDAKIEVLLLRELKEEMRLWDVLVEPARKIRIGNKLFFDESGTMVAEVIDNTTSRGRTLRFLYDCPHDEFKRELLLLAKHHCRDISSTRLSTESVNALSQKRILTISSVCLQRMRVLSQLLQRDSISHAR